MTDDLRAKIAELRRLQNAYDQSVRACMGQTTDSAAAPAGDYLAAVLRGWPLLADTAERLAAENERLKAAMTGLMHSYEAHVHLREPKPSDQLDDYDRMMRPLWERAAAVLEGKP